MANENLKQALQDHGLTVEEFADILKVDPKSVQRWVSGPTVPYPRHRAKIARALNLAEDQLWPPDPAEDARSVEAGAGEVAAQEPAVIGDVIASWAHVTDAEAPSYLTFLDQARERIDVLDTGGQLPDDLLQILREHAFDGCQTRLLTRTPREQLEQIEGLATIAVRITDALTMPTLFRADDQILLAIPLSLTQPPALLQLARRTDDGILNRVESEYQALWDDAEIFTEPELRTPV